MPFVPFVSPFCVPFALSATGGTLLTAQQPSESADGMTALHWAARRGDVAAAAAAIKAGAKLEAATRVGAYTPLHVASKEGHAAVVKALLDAGSNAQAVTANKTTALHLAAAAGSVDAVAALLDRGADVNAREGVWGQTPLIFAAANNRVEAITLLLRRGATVDLSTRTVDLPTQDAVDRAAERRRDQVLEEFRKMVPESERAAWRPTPSQVQAAMRAAREVQESPAGADPSAAGEPADQPGTVGEAVPGYSASVGTQGGLTALLHAARQGHRDAVFALLDGGAAINKVSGDHTSPLLIATMNGHFDLALELLEARGRSQPRERWRRHAALCRHQPAMGAPRSLSAAARARSADRDVSRHDEGAARGGCRSQRAQQEAPLVHVVQLLLLDQRRRRHGLLARGLRHRRRGDEAAGGVRRRSEHPDQGRAPRARVAAAATRKQTRRECRPRLKAVPRCFPFTRRQVSATAKDSNPTPTGTCRTAGCRR